MDGTGALFIPALTSNYIYYNLDLTEITRVHGIGSRCESSDVEFGSSIRNSPSNVFRV